MMNGQNPFRAVSFDRSATNRPEPIPDSPQTLLDELRANYGLWIEEQDNRTCPELTHISELLPA